MGCLTAFDKDPVEIVKTKGQPQINKVAAMLLDTALTSRKVALDHYDKVIQMTRIHLMKVVASW